MPDLDAFSKMSLYTTEIEKPEWRVIGRDQEIEALLDQFSAPLVNNAILLGEPGSGKTTLVRALKQADPDRVYLSISISAIIAHCEGSDVASRVASEVDLLFREVLEYQKETNRDIVLFLDEFHSLLQTSTQAAESLKPLLAESGAKGLRFLCATTFDEFHQYVEPNQALVERMDIIRLKEPDRAAVISILKAFCRRYGFDLKQANLTGILGKIYDYTESYIPSSSQPRKSIRILDKMLGKVRNRQCPFDMNLLGQVINEVAGANVLFQVDAASIKKQLTSRVLSQSAAADAIADRLIIATEKLNDPSRPMGSFLFTGSTGVGKTEMAKQMARLLFGSESDMIRFDMTEYTNEDSLERFRTALSEQAWEKPHSVILLDEIEKASPSITHLLLQVLDDGRLTGNGGRTVSFLSSYIVMTTNLGAELYEQLSYYFQADENGVRDIKKSALDRAVKNSLTTTSAKGDTFPAELLGRIDEIVPFQPLSDGTVRQIAQIQLKNLAKKIRSEHGIKVFYYGDVIDFLIQDHIRSGSNEGGARQLNRIIAQYVTTPVAKYIAQNPTTSVIYCCVRGKTLYENRNDREHGITESEAYIAVSDIEPIIQTRRRES